MNHNAIIVKNYKCFDGKEILVDNIKQINVVIGKNNSGKSSLLQVIKQLADPETPFFQNYRGGKIPILQFVHKFDYQLGLRFFNQNHLIQSTGIRMQDYALNINESKLLWETNQSGDKKFVSIEAVQYLETDNNLKNYVGQLNWPFFGMKFCHLGAERDINPEVSEKKTDISVNGFGATNLMRNIINTDKYDRKLVEVILLNELNKIVMPDMEYTKIFVQENGLGIWEIYLEDRDGLNVPMSKMGSGIKTIILVLILLHVIPNLSFEEPSKYVFALEELENNLHPSLQRRLYTYILQFAEKHKCYFWITTHSNIVIDLYSTVQKAQIYHINAVDKVTTISSILNPIDFKHILNDLDIRASDILQCNGIIWVEGPSDRIYINKWISLVDNTLKEGYHFSVMFYGGRLLSNLTFDTHFVDAELIPMLKLNRNAVVLMDRDRKSWECNINKTKKRIEEELGNQNVWITKGIEIENYLSSSAVEKWLKNQASYSQTFLLEEDIKFEFCISNMTNGKIKYEKNKNFFANQIVQHLRKDDIKVMDLHKRMLDLVSRIRTWNQ